MRESKIRKLIKLVEESGIDELELRRWGSTVRISHRSMALDRPSAPEQSLLPRYTADVLPTSEGTPDQAEGLFEIKAPMVGTFYRAPSPEAAPYVEIGQMIEPGQIICIIEAMKLMNEIKSEIKGKIAEILVENTEPVEFGQPLFLVESP